MNNAFFAFFDFLGNLDLALSTEKRDGPHLAQVHAHWIARLADDITVAVEFNFFFLHRLGGRVGGGLSLGYRTRAFGSSFRCSSWRSFRTRSCHSSILSLFAFSSFCSSATRILSRSSRFCALICLPFKRARQSAATLPHTASVRSSVSRAKRATSLASSAGKISLNRATSIFSWLCHSLRMASTAGVHNDENP